MEDNTNQQQPSNTLESNSKTTQAGGISKGTQTDQDTKTKLLYKESKKVVRAQKQKIKRKNTKAEKTGIQKEKRRKRQQRVRQERQEKRDQDERDRESEIK